MEPHPIPQNVTAFEFHLVGDMTLKQFLYLATGLGTAYLTFVFLAHPAPLLAWPITAVSSLLGVAFAFLPISDRPLDYWVGAYLKAVYSPTQKVWQRGKNTYKEEFTFGKRLLIYHSSLPSIQETPATAPAPPVATPPPPAPVNATPPPPPPAELPSKEELGKTVEMAQQAQSLQNKIIETEKELSSLKATLSAPHSNPEAYSAQINSILTELQTLMVQANQIKQQLSNQTEPQREPAIPKAKVKVTVATRTKQTQVVLTSLPNVINGIVVDGMGNYLDGVVVVIYDKDGLPVRALKTNKLGQFSGSTPLPNGTYTMELEKESLVFDTLQIELDGKVLPPLSIAAKRMVNV